jgi:hypothetical protein
VLSKGRPQAAVCGSEWHSSLLRLRAARRGLWSARILHNGAAPTIMLSPSTAVMRRTSCGDQRARAPCRDGCRRLTPRRSVPHRREDSLLRCSTVVRRASCGLQLQARTTCVARHKRVGAGCLWKEAQHSSLLSVRVVPRWLWSVLTLPKDAVTARLSSSSARDRGATCQQQPPASCQRRVARAALVRRRSLCL